MPRFEIVFAAVVMCSSCAVDSTPEEIASSPASLSATEASASTSGRECGPAARHRYCPRGEVCEGGSRRHPGHCRKPRCGDGVIDSSEACDDGNRVDEDGCTATCALDDNSATPGDDRAGFTVCEDLTCSPGTRCCFGAMATCSGAANCGAPTSLGSTCDGPEDCASGQKCLINKNGHTCGDAANSAGTYTACHTDADCVGATCAGTGTPCLVCVADSAGGGATCLGQ